MSKTIICMYAPANCGKTQTIRHLFIKLGGKRKVFNGKRDFGAEINFGNKKIGFASEGDPGSNQRTDLEQLAQNKCDIIVTASRTKGGTVDNIGDIAQKYKYRVIWISPFYFYDAKQTTKKQCQYFAERNADNIAMYIIDKLI